MAFQEKCEKLSTEIASQMLLDAELLLEEIEEMISQCVPIHHSNHRRHIVQEDLGSIQEAGDTLVIGGFRFENAATREELQRLNLQSRAGDARAAH